MYVLFGGELFVEVEPTGHLEDMLLMVVLLRVPQWCGRCVILERCGRKECW